MIYVDRASVLSPIDPELVHRANIAIVVWYELEASDRRRQSPDFKEREIIADQAREALLTLFSNKCAYCETSLEGTGFGVDPFRPFTDASDLSGKGSPDHYTWLFNEWENLYPACRMCMRSKRSLFPVEGPRAEPLDPIEDIRAVEQALLLDPCFDEPEKHLEFARDGTVLALTEKGETTIKVVNLNSWDLIKQRKEVWRKVDSLIAKGRPGRELEELCSPKSPFAATARAAVLASEAQLKPDEPRPISAWRNRPTERRSAEQILAEDEEAFRLTARPLRSVEITNFKALRSVTLHFGEPGSERAPWLLLLGENATGKSTVLQAIALALAGADEARRQVTPSRLLSTGAFEGSVVVWFWDQEVPVELRFSRGRDQFEGTRGASAIVLGYGALRYAERRRRAYDGSPRFSRIASLMKPIARIRYPGHWLSELDAVRFDTAARALHSILPDSSGAVMRRSRNKLYFDVGEHEASLGELSAGYQTIVGVCADIMRLLFERWDTLASATAIVLIDELDAHLHPRWTMRIVSALRTAFPQVQFVASTHDPLTLRGLRNGEVALLRRDEKGRVVVDQDLPPIEGMQVDQLLTSRVFGLNSTVDPEIEALLNEYYYLLSLPQTPQSERRIEEIRARVGDREALGRNMRERIMLEAADEYIREAERRPELLEPLDKNALSRLREIADRIDPSTETFSP